MKHVTKEAAHETRELKRAVISDLSVALHLELKVPHLRLSLNSPMKASRV